jgi:uncharacterized tellurite resistance protein B-like protein
MTFKRLFRLTSKPEDGLTQPEREAIVDVLHYCMYADKHVATAEDEFIESSTRRLDWDPNVSYEYYEGKSTAIARTALADPIPRVEFLAEIDRRLSNQGKLIALQFAERLINADGVRHEQEIAAIAALRDTLTFRPSGKKR